MTVEIREVAISSKSDKDNLPIRPTIIPWKDAKMLRSHSIGATVQEILQSVAVQDSQDVVQINIIGDPSSGKTTLAKTLGHLIHKRSKIAFSVRLFGRKELLNFEETLKTLSPANYVLIFDDLSFLGAEASSKQIEMVKKAVTEIRHLPGGKDVKIIIIKNFHYTLGLPKYLRTNDFSYFTTVGSNEDENMEKIVGVQNMGKVFHFKKIRNKIKIAPEGHKIFSYQLGTKGKFDYTYKHPFIPVLYWNGDTLRHIVAPSRNWIDPICSTCEEYTGEQHFASEVDVGKFIDESGIKFSPSTFKTAVLLKLKEQGINAFRPQLVSALRYLDKVLETKRISLEDLAVHYGFKPTNTKMRKKLDGVLSDEPLDKSLKTIDTNG